MFSEEKLSAIRNYLKEEFSEHEIADKYDFDREAQTFRLSTKHKIHLVTVSREFLDDHSASEISNILSRSHLNQYFQKENVVRIVVKNSEIRTEKK